LLAPRSQYGTVLRSLLECRDVVSEDDFNPTSEGLLHQVRCNFLYLCFKNVFGDKLDFYPLDNVDIGAVEEFYKDAVAAIEKSQSL
jgi:hypothetical protein